MAELIKVNAPVRKPLFEGVQGENESRSIQFDITPWVEELGDGAVTATAKRSQDSQPYPVTVTKDGNTVTWKPTSTDTAYAGVGSFQLEYTVDSVLAKTCIWSTMVAPSLDPAGDPPDPYDNWLAEMREIAADAIQAAQDADESADDAQAEVYEAEAWAKGTKNGTPVPSTADQYQNNAKYYSEESYKNAEAWAVGQRGGVDVPSTDPTYENNAKYWAEQSLANQYSAFIVKSASGEIASFSDGADGVPTKSLNVTITPKQSGSGDPSPSNVRPITGWTDADVHVTGKNLFDISQIVSGSTGGIDYSVSGNTLTYSGTASTSGWKTALSFQLPKVGVYHFHMDTTGNGGNFLEGFSAKGTDITINCTSTDTWYRIAMVAVSAGTAVSGTISNIQIELGSSATEYVPYTGHTTPVPLGQTVYGGEVDVVSGELKITHAMVDMGSLSYSFAALSNNRKSFTHTFTDIKRSVNGDDKVDAYSSMYTASTYNGTWANGNMSYNIANNSNSILFINNAYSDAASFQTAMAGQTLVYPLATPTTVQLTPTQVASLLGQNNVWSDCGAVEVEYRADPTLAYAELQALILENL